MQFHLNGFEPGDPEIANLADRQPSPGEVGALPREVDVLIVGCGPAGLTLAAQLSAFAEIRTCIVDQKPGPLLRGQADGIACRTMEMFEAFGFSERVLKEACWINETTFWSADENNGANIVRTSRVQDVEDGLSEFPHVVLNQARVHDFYLDLMRKSRTRLKPYYSRRLVDLEIERPAACHHGSAHPVAAKLQRAEDTGAGEIELVRARYLVGCDGARSAVRKCLGLTLRGDSANQAWGVMDVLATTDFPDIRCKTFIQSANGSIIIIPREGGYLFRLYIELDQLHRGERISERDITADDLLTAARRIFAPYTLDAKEIPWWSVYEIGQRLCDRFDDIGDAEARRRTPRVFIAGDACHTHSPKAGQGMNVSMQDGFNLGWKLAAVLRKRSSPALLRTYSAERQAIAKELIDFDREWAALLASSRSNAGAHTGGGPAEMQRYFVSHGRYTAGTATRYHPSLITGEATHQHLASGFPIGMRFHSAPVVRLADAMPLHLGHTIKADGRWRIFAFAGANDFGTGHSPMHALCDFLAGSPASPARKFTAEGADIDATIDIRSVFQARHTELAIERMPELLLPRKGRYALTDFEKIFCPDFRSGDIFDLRGINRAQGCLVLVRPDQYVAHVLPLDAYDALASFFDGFMTPRE